MELDQPVGHDAAALSPIRQACFLSGPANPTCLGGQCHHAYPPCKCAGPGYSDALKHFASGHRLTGLPTCRADGVEVQLASRIALYDQGAARSQTAQQPFKKTGKVIRGREKLENDRHVDVARWLPVEPLSVAAHTMALYPPLWGAALGPDEQGTLGFRSVAAFGMRASGAAVPDRRRAQPKPPCATGTPSWGPWAPGGPPGV